LSLLNPEQKRWAHTERKGKLSFWSRLKKGKGGGKRGTLAPYRTTVAKGRKKQRPLQMLGKKESIPGEKAAETLPAR